MSGWHVACLWVDVRYLVPALLAVLGGAFALACGDAAPGRGSTSTDEIVGGVAAKGSRLDAIGALGRVKDDGAFTYYCTATLVAPRLLVTAKHCVAKTGQPPYTETETIYFGIGENSREPKRTVKVAKTWMSPLDEGGYITRGSDVAMMSLEEPIEDIEPLPLAGDHIDASLVGGRVSAVGYGIRDIARSSGLRRAGTLTLRATNGPLVQSAFASADELVSFVRAEGGAAFSETADEARVRELWDKSILENHELFAGVAPGDAQPCSGDSGGPLVGRVGGRLVVLAVVSGSFKLTNRNANPCSVVGEVYATFPADVQQMFEEAASATEVASPERITAKGLDRGSSVPVPDVPADAADRCPGVTTLGECTGGVALRCIDPKEGTPRITRTDCTLLGQRCAIVEPPAASAAAPDGGAEASAPIPDGPTAECVDK